MKKKIFNLIYCFVIILTTLLMFINSNNTTNIFNETFCFIIRVIIPSLFPFMIFVNFILYTNTIDYLAKLFSFLAKPFKVSGYGIVCIIASIIGGFPYSAIIVKTFIEENKIDKSEANRLLYFMFFPSISFLITLYNIDNIFIYIIISLYITSFLFLFVSKFFIKNKVEELKNKITIDNNFPKTYMKVLSNTISSIFSISFAIIFFRLISYNLTYNINNEYIYNLTNGIFEFSYTTLNVLSKESKTIIDYLIINFIISFSSLSIIFQYIYYILDINIDIKKLLLFRIATCIISTIIFLIIF